MPYKVKGQCIYHKDTNKKVGCTKGSVKKYLAALHANADEAVQSQPTITEMKGGLSHGKTPQEIADKHGVPLSKINHQISMGKKVEMEHTNNPSIAKEIAMDHLMEIPDYYTRLAKMEKKAEGTLDKSET